MRAMIVFSLLTVPCLACGVLEDSDDRDPTSTENRDGDDHGDGDAGDSGLSWYSTCGHPVCGGPLPDPAPEDACTDEIEGASCSEAGASCATGNCGQRLLCTDTDPKAASCPVSRRAAKREIRHLDAAEKQKLRKQLAAIKLATYRYKDAPAHVRRLGFIIDEVGPGYAVLPGGERVDVYGFTSMAVAALQAQEEQIAALEARLQAVEKNVRSCPKQ